MGSKRATASDGGPRELIPARTYLGVIVGVYDLGTQPGYQGGAATNKFILEWELHFRATRRRDSDVARDDAGHVLKISQFVGLKLGTSSMPSALLKVIEAVDGAKSDDWIASAEFDIESLLEGAAVLVVGHKGDGEKARHVIESVAPLDEDDDDPEPESNAHYFELTDDVLRSGKLPDYLPVFVAKQVMESAEWKARGGSGSEKRRSQPAESAADDEGDDRRGGGRRRDRDAGSRRRGGRDSRDGDSRNGATSETSGSARRTGRRDERGRPRDPDDMDDEQGAAIDTDDDEVPF